MDEKKSKGSFFSPSAWIAWAWELSIWRAYFYIATLGIIGGIVVYGGTLVFFPQPIPEKVCSKSDWDRMVFTLGEPVARLIYFFPLNFCWNVNCMTWYTRAVMKGWGAFTNTFMQVGINPNQWWRDLQSPLVMEYANFSSVQVRTYQLPSYDVHSDGALVYMHGGTFLFGKAWMFDTIARDLAEKIHPRLIVAIDYRRIPDTIYPGAVEDCEAAIDYLMEHGAKKYGIDPRKIIVMGESAGGTLAAVMARKYSQDPSKRYPLHGQVLVHPALQFSDLQTPSYQLFHEDYAGLALPRPYPYAAFMLVYAGLDVDTHPEFVDDVLENKHVSNRVAEMRDQVMNFTMLPREFQATGLQSKSPRGNKLLMEKLEPVLMDPDFAPLMAKDLRGLPTSLIVTVDTDFLRDDGILYARRLQEAGVSTTWSHYDDGFNSAFHFARVLDVSQRILTEVSDWTKALMESPAVEKTPRPIEETINPFTISSEEATQVFVDLMNDMVGAFGLEEEVQSTCARSSFLGQAVPCRS